MGAYSTVDLTRDEAINMIMNALDEATDEEVADALGSLVSERTINNYRIINPEPQHDDMAR